MLINRFSSNGWRPNSERLPLAWWRADKNVSVSAGKVVSWTDLTPHAWVLASTNSGTRPAYSATAWNSSQAGIVFGSGALAYTDLKTSTSSGLSNIGTSLSVRIYAVWTVGSHASLQKFVCWVNAAGTSGVYETEINSSHVDEVSYSSGGVLRTGSTLTGAHVTEHVINNSTSPHTRSKIDGTISINDTNSVPTAVTDTFAIGGNVLIGNDQLDGTLAELVIYDTSVTDYDAQNKFRAYAKSQWSGLP